MTLPMQIYVDADACPVKAEVLRVATRHEVIVHMVSNSWMRLDDNPLINRVVVHDGPDAADDWIAERVGAADVVVTADILLAARCLKAGAQCITPNGKAFSEASIGMAVAMREVQRHLRETGESRGFNPSFSQRDRSQFLQALEQAIQVVLRKR
ncbi:MAG TPA: YaiI/YqxD family protein [Hyphomicrobium sp.]|nr:YaiI/YqxD family protein [Hyphomicrobium sp.]